METRARFGCTAPVGTTDDGRFRRLTVQLPVTFFAVLQEAAGLRAQDVCVRLSNG